jgi:hypothetical protein
MTEASMKVTRKFETITDGWGRPHSSTAHRRYNASVITEDSAVRAPERIREPRMPVYRLTETIDLRNVTMEPSGEVVLKNDLDPN